MLKDSEKYGSTTDLADNYFCWKSADGSEALSKVEASEATQKLKLLRQISIIMSINCVLLVWNQKMAISYQKGLRSSDFC